MYMHESILLKITFNISTIKKILELDAEEL